jgi:hypothetical protein
MIIITIKVSDNNATEESTYIALNRVLSQIYESYDIEVTGKKVTIKNTITRETKDNNQLNKARQHDPGRS